MSDLRTEPPPQNGSEQATAGHQRGDKAPGALHRKEDLGSAVRAYLIGLGLAALLTCGSFFLSYTHLVYAPVVPIALIVFALAQIGVHLVFFLHITSGPENTNNTLALAFGFGIVLLVVGGSMWIMTHLNHNMMPMSRMMEMQH